MNTQGYESQFCYMVPTERRMKWALAPMEETYRTGPEFRMDYDGYAELLGAVTTLRENGVIISFQHLLADLYDRLLSESDTRLLHVSGRDGAATNAMIQLLYLRMADAVGAGMISSSAPFYMNLNDYRSTCENRAAAIAAMEQDLSLFWSYTAGHPERTPILFINGIRNYTLDDFALDDYLAYCMREHVPDAKLVIATECAVIMNQSRQHSLPDFANGRFRYEASIESVNLLNQEQTETYFTAFEKLYRVEGTPICRKLRTLGLTYVDTCQIRMLLPGLEDAENISDLYESVSKAFLDSGDRYDLDVITDWAYQFICTGRKPEPLPARLQQLVTVHDSFRYFFLARWYVSRMRSGTAQEKLQDLDLVLPEVVTCFVSSMLSGDAGLESILLAFIEQNYARLSLGAKVQMNYWLGGIRSPGVAAMAENLLLRNDQEIRRAPEQMHGNGDRDERQKLLLMRSITVGLIAKGYPNSSGGYIASLIHNPVANELNRGFQLAYYGDTPGLPTKWRELKFGDDIRTGKRTLDYLFADTTTCLREKNRDPLLEMNLFTICSLLQARIEDNDNGIKFDILPYLMLVCRQIRAWLELHSAYNDELFPNYLRMVQRDFERRIDHWSKPWSFIGTEVFDEYNRRVLRTGWKECGIPEPESVAEHTYSMWLIGTMFLQDSYPQLPDYSKNEVLNMIMIHDLAETQTGDITTPVKNRNRKKFDAQENEEMQIFLLRESYPGYSCQRANYERWQQWNDQKNINARIAREIDKIQLMYQALRYKLQYPDIMTDELLRDMLGAAGMITTMPGRKIYHTLIRNHERFREVFERLDII